MIFVSCPCWAQDDLLQLLEEETANEETIDYTFATFKATRIINGQSVEMTSGGVLSFIIQHRFGKISDGIEEFFGLDQATIRFGLEYGISDRLNVAIGRSSFQKTYDGYLKFKLLRQSAGAKNFPFSMVLFSNIAINSSDFPEPDRKNYFTSRLSFTHQILIARKFSKSFSMQISPTLVHRNLVETNEEENDIPALGIGGRIKLSSRVSLNAEYYYQFSEINREKTFDSFSVGLDIETGGHVFQLHFTNSKGMIERYFISETNEDFFKGDIFFGFNINRVFTISAKE
ncbi:MAG: DUF5777 family beta-barrel protein [Cyclobacteriaceae bacterium]|nr:DUF5777 family beta-barrel protein [Cyclobacteriaceae bacterium]